MDFIVSLWRYFHLRLISRMNFGPYGKGKVLHTIGKLWWRFDIFWIMDEDIEEEDKIYKNEKYLLSLKKSSGRVLHMSWDLLHLKLALSGTNKLCWRSQREWNLNKNLFQIGKTRRSKKAINTGFNVVYQSCARKENLTKSTMAYKRPPSISQHYALHNARIFINRH